MNTTILLVEDEKLLSQSVVQYLSNSGIDCTQAFTFNSAINKMSEFNFDCIVIDIGLPDGSGIDLITYIKKKKLEAGLIIISARNSLEDKLEGFTTGADDFLVKPFHLSELSVRVAAIIRRKKFHGQAVITAGEIEVDTMGKSISIHHQNVELTQKEFQLLLFLIINKNKVISKNAIAEHLWGDDMDIASNFDFIYAHIKNLRKKIIAAGGEDRIRSIYGVGYKMLLP